MAYMQEQLDNKDKLIMEKEMFHTKREERWDEQTTELMKENENMKKEI